MKPAASRPRGPPRAECVIKGEPYYNVHSAARMINVVSESTLRGWVVNGWTSFGLSLDVVQWKGRLLVPELSVLVIKEFLQEHPLSKPGSSSMIREEFRQAVRLAMFDYIRPRSTYSRARSLRPTPPR
jgi:hypothetical protein